jgi:hypothetical protein
LTGGSNSWRSEWRLILQAERQAFDPAEIPGRNRDKERWAFSPRRACNFASNPRLPGSMRRTLNTPRAGSIRRTLNQTPAGDHRLVRGHALEVDRDLAATPTGPRPRITGC